MIKLLLIRPSVYVANLSAFITVWLFIKFALDRTAPIWIDRLLI
jgi:hypothetical protein